MEAITYGGVVTPQGLTVLGLAFKLESIMRVPRVEDRWEAKVGGVVVRLSRTEAYGRPWMASASFPGVARVSVYGHGETPEEALRALAPELAAAADDVTRMALTLAEATGEGGAA